MNLHQRSRLATTPVGMVAADQPEYFLSQAGPTCTSVPCPLMAANVSLQHRVKSELYHQDNCCAIRTN